MTLLCIDHSLVHSGDCPPPLPPSRLTLFIMLCIDHSLVHSVRPSPSPPQVNKQARCLVLLKEYVMDCDEEYGEERGIPPHGK